MCRWCLLVMMLAVGVAAVSSRFAAAQGNRVNAADVVGTWQLNLQKSSWGEFPPPKSRTVDIVRFDESGIEWTATEIDEKGNTISSSWEGPLDGTPTEASGTTIGVLYAFRSTEQGMRMKATYPDGSKITGLATISADGKTLLLRRQMTSPTRGNAEWTEVYEKVP